MGGCPDSYLEAPKLGPLAPLIHRQAQIPIHKGKGTGSFLDKRCTTALISRIMLLFLLPSLPSFHPKYPAFNLEP
jgi:hypothetical protein